MITLPSQLDWLVSEYGFEPETVGGGNQLLSFYAPNGNHVMISCLDGGGFPEPDNWHVCAYLAKDDGDPCETFRSDDEVPVSLRQAVAACLAIATN